MAQNGGGFSRTARTQGAATWAAAAQSSAPCSAARRWATAAGLGPVGEGQAVGGAGHGGSPETGQVVNAREVCTNHCR